MNHTQMFDVFIQSSTKQLSTYEYCLNHLNMFVDKWTNKIEIQHPSSDIKFSLTPVQGEHSVLLQEFDINPTISTPDDIKIIMTEIATEIMINIGCQTHCVFRNILSI